MGEQVFSFSRENHFWWYSSANSLLCVWKFIVLFQNSTKLERSWFIIPSCKGHRHQHPISQSKKIPHRSWFISPTSRRKKHKRASHLGRNRDHFFVLQMLIELGALVLIVNSTFSLVTRRSKDWKRGSWSARRQIYRTNRFPNGDINPQYSAPPSFSIQGFDHHPRWSNQTRGTEWSAKLRKNLSKNICFQWFALWNLWHSAM